MNYEQKYEEALERAKKLYNEIKNNEIIGFPGQLEEIFPELRDSEDERMINEIIHTITGYHPTHTTEEIENMVAYLEKQKEQKPAEWSEEDEKMRDRLVKRLQYASWNTRTDTTSPNITYFDEMEWLKSLRPQPHWKPSEEQMGAIRTAIDVLRGQVYDGKELYPGTSHVLTMMLNYFQTDNNDKKV